MISASLAAMFVETDEHQIEHDLLFEIAQLKAQIHTLSAAVKTLAKRTVPKQSALVASDPASISLNFFGEIRSRAPAYSPRQIRIKMPAALRALAFQKSTSRA